MKLLIVAINSQYVHASPVPWLLKATCASSAELEITVREFTINDRLDYIETQILLAQPDFLAVSCYIWNIDLVHKIIPDIKKLMPELKVLLGGPEAEHTPKPWFCDTLLFGDGEQSLPEYFGIQAAPWETVALAAASDICENGKGKIIYLETVRGCPFKCSYCLAPQSGKVRKMDLIQVEKMIEIYMASKVRQVKFVDRTFNADRSRALAIIKMIESSYLKAKSEGKTPPESWHFEVAGDLFDEPMFEIIERLPAGLVQFEVGVQSLNGHALGLTARQTDSERVLKNITRLVAAGTCLVHADLIAGLPGEGIQSFKAGFDRLHSTNPHQLQLGFLKVLKGSALAEQACELGLVWSENSPYQVLQTRELSWSEMLQLSRVEEMVERCWNNGRFTETVKQLADGKYFDFYQALEGKLAQESSLPMSATSMALELWKFANASNLRRTILIDLLTSCFPVKIPEALKFGAPAKSKFAEISREATLVFGDAKTHFEMVSDSEVLILNCSERHPVTGRLSYLIHSMKS